MLAMLNHLAVFAAEHGTKLGLTGHIRGVMIVVSSVTLFCGSVYLLLATNLGTRLGFLVAAAGLTGFLMILAAIWSTSQFPLNSFHGIETHWTVKEVRSDPSQSFYASVRTIDASGKKATDVQAGDIKATADTALTTEGSEFLKFQRSDQYIVEDTKVIGGGRTGFLNLSHRPLFGVLKIRPVKAVDVPFGSAPPPPQGDPTKPASYVIVVRNLGSVRMPQLLTLIASALLFGLCLLSMHRMERAAEAAAAAPAPAPA